MRDNNAGMGHQQQQISQSRKMEMAAHREQHSKSAVGMMSGNAGNSAGQGSGNIKRREKDRLIMQEWLTKSN